MTKPALLVTLYGNPDRYPPTYNAVLLLRDRFRVRVLCRANADAPGVSWPADVRVDRVGPALADREKNAQPAAVKLREYLGFAWAVRAALAEDRPPVVFAYEPHALVALALAGRRARVVYQRHEIEEPGPIDRRSLQGWILYASWRLSRRADLVVFPEPTRAALHQRVTEDRRAPLIVPNFPLRRVFPEPEPFAEVIAARWDRRTLLYRGAIGADNGIVQMVRALPLLEGSIVLRLCGGADIEFARTFRALAVDLGVEDRLRYDGFVPYERLNRETAQAIAGLVLYQPKMTNLAFNATATNKLYEYAACGVPVVVPDNAAFRSFLSGESWVEFADPTDPSAVAAAVSRLLADREVYAARCFAARRAFEARFNYEAVFAPLRERLLALAGEP